jgi:hypothetical protein
VTTLDPFFIYKITDANGQMVHSSIYYHEHDPANPPTPADIREALLISASYAGSDYEWPEHGHPNGKDLTISLFGPFVPGEAADTMTTVDFHAIPEDDLP